MSKHCHHGRRAYECTKCPGKGICDHGRRRSRCILCKQNGAHVAGICTHNRQRHECPDCLKLGETLQKRAWCNACGSKRLSSEARRAEGLCASCAGLQPKTQDNFIKEVIAKLIIRQRALTISCLVDRAAHHGIVAQTFVGWVLSAQS